MSFVVPAVLASSREDVMRKLSLVAAIPSVSRVQVDVVDGLFAQPASWPYTALAELETMCANNEVFPWLDRLEYEIDLMCFDTNHISTALLTLGATRLIFHAESTSDLPRFLASARVRFGAGSNFAPNLISFGLALGVASDLALIEPCLSEVSFIQFMGIAQIGRQGQPFDHRVIEKIRLFHSRHPDIPLQVDGGVSLENAKELLALGVSELVIGSALLGASDPAAAVAAFEDLKSPYTP